MAIAIIQFAKMSSNHHKAMLRLNTMHYE